MKNVHITFVLLPNYVGVWYFSNALWPVMDIKRSLAYEVSLKLLRRQQRMLVENLINHIIFSSRPYFRGKKCLK
jgi:hypothetical protein